MADFLSHVTIATPRNGTTTHTVTPSSGTVVTGTLFTPTAGRLLVCSVDGAVTSTTPAGWTLPAAGSAINFTGLYVWWRTAAGSDSLTTTHNQSNYPVVFDFYEYPAGSTFSGSASATVVSSGGAGPNLTGLTGTNWTAGTVGVGANGSPTIGGITWNAGTELVDTGVAFSTTDGYLYGLTATDADASTSRAYTATLSTTGTYGSAERLTFAVKVSAGAAATPYRRIGKRTF